MEQVVQELLFRGFRLRYIRGLWQFVQPYMKDYTVLKRDKWLNRARLLTKYRQNPSAHQWTKRRRPLYLTQ